MPHKLGKMSGNYLKHIADVVTQCQSYNKDNTLSGATAYLADR